MTQHPLDLIDTGLPAAPSEPPVAPRPPLTRLAWVMAGLSGATVLATLLPWLKVTAFVVSLSIAGFEADDGKAVAVLGVAGAALCGLAIRRGSHRYVVAAGVAALAALAFAGHVAYNIAGADMDGMGTVQYGSGLVLALVLSLAGIAVAAYTAVRFRRTATPAQPATP